MIFFYSLVISALSLYSYSLIDPNITFIKTWWWELFREKMVYFGYYQRANSWMIYLILVVLLFVFNYLFIKKYKRFDPIKLAILIGAILLFSYPLLSHDFFNYMFDARIATYYHQNPYLFKALDFPSDPWLRFLQWTHRTYPYGPVFLLVTLIPSFFSLGKFILAFLFFKATFIIFYILAVFYLNKLKRKYAIIFATNPLIIIEGLVNSHNDLIAVSLGVIGIYYLLASKGLKSKIFFLLSAGVKYITFPLIFLTRLRPGWNKFIFYLMIGVILYLSFKSEIQPWYFLNLFIFLPLLNESINPSTEFMLSGVEVLRINRLNIFFFGLLVSYYPYIRLGGWDSLDKINLKHIIIGIFFVINITYFLLIKLKHHNA